MTVTRAVVRSGSGMRAELMSVAPMMDYTDAHFRALCRMMSRRVTLYTEMVVDKALLHSVEDDVKRAATMLHRGLDAAADDNDDAKLTTAATRRGDTVLQLGGSDATTMAAAARVAAKYGYASVNVNCGCPSEKVAGGGRFGAALMREPETVRDIVQRAREESGLEVSVKCRLGVDDDDSYAQLCEFVQACARGGAEHVIVHARKALLSGLSPGGPAVASPIQPAPRRQRTRRGPRGAGAGGGTSPTSARGRSTEALPGRWR